MLRLALLALLAASSCAAAHAAIPENLVRIPTETAELDAVRSLDEIASRLERAYRDARFIEIEGSTSTTGGERLDYRYLGTQESFRTICMRNGAVFAAIALHDGRVQEFVPDHPKRLLMEYDAEIDYAISRRVYHSELDCLWGNHFTLWIGPKSELWPHFSERIRSGQLHEREVINGHLCDVVVWENAYEDIPEIGQQLIHKFTYYIDVQESLIHRIERINTVLDDENMISSETWIFAFQTMKLRSEIPTINWNVWPDVDAIASGAEAADADCDPMNHRADDTP